MPNPNTRVFPWPKPGFLGMENGRVTGFGEPGFITL